MNYLCGVIHEFKPSFKGKSDVHASLMYKELRCSRRGLPQNVKQMGMRREMDLNHVNEILKELNRKAVVVCILNMTS